VTMVGGRQSDGTMQEKVKTHGNSFGEQGWLVPETDAE
jgi:hypothetical protein